MSCRDSASSDWLALLCRSVTGIGWCAAGTGVFMHPTDGTARERTQGGMDEVFFSYPRADRAAVLPLVRALRNAGVGVFLDESGVDEFEGITD